MILSVPLPVLVHYTPYIPMKSLYYHSLITVWITNLAPGERKEGKP